MCRADWGQLVRTEHHLAPPNGPRGGASNGLNPYLDLASVRCIVADFLLPVPRRHALGEQLRDTHADAAGQSPAHRREHRSVWIGWGRWFVTRDQLPARLQQPLRRDSRDRSDHSDVELPEQFLRRSHQLNLPCRRLV